MSKEGLDGLIQALQIFRKYGNPSYPTHCEHDILMICGITPETVSNEDKEILEELGFSVGKQLGEEAFYSYRYGSA
jgi:hypothetical protein